MAALNVFTGTSQNAEIIPPKLINTYIQAFPYPKLVGLQIAWAEPGRSTIPFHFPRWGSLSVPAGTKAQTDTFQDVALGTDDELATPAFVGMRLPISHELQMATGPGVQAQRIDNAMRALLVRIETDLLAMAANADESSGDVTEPYTLQRLRDDRNAYAALEVDPSSEGTAAVISLEAGGQLVDSYHTTAATRPTADGDVLGIGARYGSGFVMSYHGIAVYQSSRLAEESTGHSGIMTEIGRQASSLGLVVSESPNVRTSDGDEAAARAVDFVIMRAMYGVTNTNPGLCLELLVS